MRLLNIKVSGLVQGVFFRAEAKKQADKLNLKGFAQNMSDGSVYIEAEGQQEKLDQFIKWCNIGPSMARIEKVVVSESPMKNFTKFEIF